MIDLLSIEQIRELENNYKRSNNVSEAELIQRAAQELFARIKCRFNEQARFLIIAGKGNNGADGHALFDILLAEGYNASLLDAFSVDLEIDLDLYDVIVDAIFGIGLKGRVANNIVTLIERINGAKPFKIAVDVPSGLCANSGLVMGAAVKADLTATFIAPKVGMFLNGGSEYCGEIAVCDIGIEPSAQWRTALIEPSDLSFIEKRATNTHKGNYGKVNIMGGCSTMAGAAVMSALAAARSGAGLSTLVVAKSLGAEFRLALLQACPESMLYFVDDIDGNVVFNQAQAQRIADCDCVAMGMGMGRNKELAQYIKYFANHCNKLILDADALNILSDDLSLIDNARAQIVLTPNLPEFSRLSKIGMEQIEQNALALAKEFAARNNVTLALKGATIIITNGKRAYLCNGNLPALAKGGTGDIFCGIAAPLFARYEPMQAMLAAAHTLFSSARRALKAHSENSLLATDVVKYIDL